jgi:hypothetical protein
LQLAELPFVWSEDNVMANLSVASASVSHLQGALIQHLATCTWPCVLPTRWRIAADLCLDRCDGTGVWTPQQNCHPEGPAVLAIPQTMQP